MKKILLICLFHLCVNGKSQSFLFPGNVFFDFEHQRNISADSSAYLIHTSFLPYGNAERSYEVRNNDLLLKEKKWFGRKLFNEDLVELQYVDPETGPSQKFDFHISPLFNFQGGLDVQDSSREKLFVNSRGVLLKGGVGEKFRFESAFVENQSTLPSYQDAFALSSGVIPGSGRWKKFKDNGYDFAMASGFISYKASKYFQLTIGSGKHKAGNGYRSLLLSDNSFNYPYLKFTHSWWKGRVQYVNIYAVLMNMTDGGVNTPPFTEKLFQKKLAAFHHLSVNLTKYLSISVFQSLIHSHADSTNRLSPDASYFNPLMFSNYAVYDMADSHNMMAGFDISVRPVKNVLLYGQVAIDELGSATSISNKHGWQTGAKYLDAFGLKNLFLQLEYNVVRPFTYSATDAWQSYTHYNQALAHPLGANFKELVGLFFYRYKRFFVQGKLNYIVQGQNNGFNYGQDIFVSDFAPALNTQNQNQGDLATTVILDGKVGYLFNPKSNMNISAGMLYRKVSFTTLQPTPVNYFYISFSTSLYNQYWDF